MVKAADILRLVLENSKGRAHAPGEIKTPSYDNLNTPDNHKRGSREVRAKNLGDRPARKKVAQTTKPKTKAYDVGGPAAPVKVKEARTAGAKRRYGQGNNENQAENAIDDGNDDPRQVQEAGGNTAPPSPKTGERRPGEKIRGKKPVKEGVTDAVAEFLMKMSGPKVGQKLYQDLKAERPDLYQQLVQAFKRMAVGTKGMGMVHDASAFKNMMNDPEAIQLASQLRRWAARKLRNNPEIVAWLQQKAEKLNAKGLSTVDPLGGDEPEEDLRDAVGHPSQYRPGLGESSKTSKSAPGEMRKPAVKTDTPAKSASVRSGSLSPEKKVPVSDKKPALNKDAAEFVRVSVKKVEEGVKALAAMGFRVPGLKK